MRALVQVAAREIEERRSALVAAAVAGLLPFLVPLLPWTKSDAHSVRGVAAFALTLSVGLGFALALGGTILVRDLVEGRLSFYFSRPLPAAAIWGGKLLAAFLLTAGAIALCLLPVTLVDGAHLGGMLTGEGVFTFGGSLALAAAALILVAHVVMSAIRTRTPWLVVDLVLGLMGVGGALAAALSVLYISVSLRAGFGSGPGEVFVAFLAVSFLAAVVTASYAQVSVGRTDPRRAHAALSKTFWGIVVAATVVVNAGALFVRTAPLSSVVAAEWADAPPAGGWTLVGGAVTPIRGGYSTSFLVDTETGRSIRLGPHLGALEFSEDGRHAAWIIADVSIRRPSIWSWELVTADLSAARPAAGQAIPLTFGWPTIAISKDGARVAVAGGDSVSVYDAATMRLLTAAHVETNDRHARPFFVSNDLVRVVVRSRPATLKRPTANNLEIFELDVARKSLSTIATLPAEVDPAFSARALTLAGSGRFLFIEGKGERVTLRDGRNGALLATLYRSTAEKTGIGSALLRADGGLVLAEFSESGSRLLSFSPDGLPLGTLPIPGYRTLRLVAEGAGGRLLLTGRALLNATWSTLFSVDSRGVIEKIASDVSPISQTDFWSSPALQQVSSRSPRAQLFLTKDHALVRIDLETGAKKVIAGPKV